ALCGSASVLYLTRGHEAAAPRPLPPPVEPFNYPGAPAVSPDGHYVAFSAPGSQGRRMLWLRPAHAQHATAIGGSEGGYAPFGSPDGRTLGFFADRSLKRVPVAGGAPQVICAADALAGGGSWDESGTILFAPGLHGGLFRVSAAGGSSEPV